MPPQTGACVLDPHTLVRKPLVLVASDRCVRVLDGDDTVASHERSWERGRQIEDRRHLDGLEDDKRRAREHRGRNRLMAACPHAQAFLEKVALQLTGIRSSPAPPAPPPSSNASSITPTSSRSRARATDFASLRRTPRHAASHDATRSRPQRPDPPPLSPRTQPGTCPCRAAPFSALLGARQHPGRIVKSPKRKPVRMPTAGEEFAPMLAQRAGELLERLHARAHRHGRPSCQKVLCPPAGGVVPEVLELFLEQACTNRAEIDPQRLAQAASLVGGHVLATLEQQPPRLGEHRGGDLQLAGCAPPVVGPCRRPR
jgi:hypothetical protein